MIDRGRKSPQAFNHDLFVGTRFALNNEDDLQLLSGIIYDLYNSSKFYNLELSQRIGDSIQASLEARIIFDIHDSDPFKAYENESYAELKLGYYF